MKKHLLLFCTMILMGLSAQTYAQATPLYVGYHQYSSTPNQLRVYDTTGGVFTILDTKTLTTDVAFPVQGTFGLTLRPSTNDMYILYHAGGGMSDRRIGLLDTVSAIITDIGLLGNMSDICFVDDQMYATSSSLDGHNFYEVDITDASTTLLFSHTPSGSSVAMCYDYFNDQIIKSVNYSDFTSIDVVGLTETNLSASSHPGWVSSMAMKNDSMIFVSNGLTTWEVNMNTFVFTDIGDFGDYTHAMAFNQGPFYIIVNGPYTFCDNENVTELASSESGTAYQWLLDGTPIAGATDSTHIPVASGSYTLDVDGSVTGQVTITVLVSPIADFTAVPNPVDLGVDVTGSVDFTNTSTGGDDYHWDFGGGFTSSSENPTYPFVTVGSYDVEFVVTDLTNGCSDTAWVTIDVINSTGIDELSADFSIYPVPTEDIVYLNMSGAEGNYHVELRDIQGKLISSKVVSADSNSLSFDLTDYEAGAYLINIFNDSEEGSFKLIKK